LSKTSIRGAGHQFSRSDAELADILARPRGEQTQVTNDGVRVFVDLSKHTIVNFVDLVAQQHAQRALARKKEAKLAKKQQHAKRIAEPESSDAMEVDPPEETGPESAVQSEADGGDGEDVGESVGESDNSDNSDNNSEDSDDNDSDNPPPKKDFLDNLMDRFEKLYYVLDEEDEEERRVRTINAVYFSLDGHCQPWLAILIIQTHGSYFLPLTGPLVPHASSPCSLCTSYILTNYPNWSKITYLFFFALFLCTDNIH
jgi:hypothetical protein